MTHGQEAPAPGPPTPPPGPRRGRGWLALALFVLALVALGAAIYAGIQDRRRADANLKRATDEAAVPSVVVARPTASAPADELILPGTTQAFTDAPIYARASGYLKRWHADIGAHVTQGQLLAEIETPELDQQLRQARADLDTARANLDLARTTAARWQLLLKSNSVAQQETDEKVGDLNAKRATEESAAANVNRLEELQSFQKVNAPFEGVITRRNIDVGALVDAGANAPGRELYRLSAIGRLRVYVSVPQTYAAAARPGTAVTITLEELPGKVFTGTLARTSNAIDPTARTLLTEVDIENPAGELLPGAYVVVHLRIERPLRGVNVPANALLFRSDGLQVGVVRNGRAELVSVKVGRDYGRTVEVVSGLGPNDAIILDPPDSLVTGTAVRVIERPAGKAAR